MVDNDSCSCLEELKKQYLVFKDKYNLPEFYDLNRVFDIEDIDSDSEFLLRKIRRVISEKVSSYLRFIEVILNPSSTPLFFFKLIKKLEESDRDYLSEIYDSLGKFEIEILSLDIDYSEEKEAEFIKKIFYIFNQEIKEKLLKIINKMNNGEERAKSYSNGEYVG